MYNETANDLFNKQMKRLSEINPTYNNQDYSEPEPDFIVEDPEHDRWRHCFKPHPKNKIGKNANIYTLDLRELA